MKVIFTPPKYISYMIANFFPCFLAMFEDFVIQAAVQGQISSQPEMGKNGGYLGVVVPNGPNAVHWYQIPRGDRKLRRFVMCAKVSLR